MRKGTSVWCKVRARKAIINVPAMVVICSDGLGEGLNKGMSQ